MKFIFGKLENRIANLKNKLVHLKNTNFET